jgi:hypothetical protein
MGWCGVERRWCSGWATAGVRAALGRWGAGALVRKGGDGCHLLLHYSFADDCRQDGHCRKASMGRVVARRPACDKAATSDPTAGRSMAPPPCWRQRIEWDGGRFSYSCAWLLLLSYRAGLRRTPPPVLPLADRGGYGKAKDLIMVLRLESSEWKHALKVSAGEKPWDQSSTHASKH